MKVRIPLNQRWHQGLLALIFSLFILAFPLQVLHKLDALNQPQHSEQDCPCHHVVSNDLPPPQIDLPVIRPVAHQSTRYRHRLSDWLSAQASARDPPVFSHPFHPDFTV
ncbi:hypothetical protein [Photobacterium sp. TLY01]|uniref:hypothetical protein n=1 Tax=Photobacterium sp. TLY01 TaxID=2907534 RepID=UPI001F1AD9BF|nr:hypothetical protein [Photobacterium sp. TLY01]UIP27647.1 hypothetical protein LN341_13670 [Photobacterium sp. TLY01]